MRLRAVTLLAIPGERTRRQNAALFREMFERVFRKEMTPDIATLDVVRARHDDEVGIRADHIERIELDAAQTLEHVADAARAAA